MLTAARFVPIYSESNLHDPQVEPIRKALDFILEKQEPYPSVVRNRYYSMNYWHILMYRNRGAICNGNGIYRYLQ
ncbi:hypothetical protein [Gloeocapsopsis crepidinum]|uniref:hypothetical protein n=1 Tax=Gloeocapsopsis crepidinum TaxID=693223 RepID=UPI001D137ECB|nr:hypothetical protein [Gloeocapsopsis crepidinum]